MWIACCGVNAHFKNNIPEGAIGDLTETASAMLLPAKARWPNTAHLCLTIHVLNCCLHLLHCAFSLCQITDRSFLWCHCWMQHERQSHFWMSHVCTTDDFTAGNCHPRSPPPKSCMQFELIFQLVQTIHLPLIILSIWWFLWNHISFWLRYCKIS